MAKGYLAEESGKGSSSRLIQISSFYFAMVETCYISYSYVELMRAGIETGSQIPIQLMPYVLIFVAGGVSMRLLKEIIEKKLAKRANE